MSRSRRVARQPRKRGLAACAGASATLALLAACGNDPANQGSTNGYRISGDITLAGAPSSATVVSVDGSGIWTATTDALGQFAIDGVPGGQHTIAASRSNEDGTFSERASALEVTGDVVVDTLVLPQPLLLAPAVTSGQTVALSWLPTDASDFREYKLYRRDSPGIDEIAGELIFVSTARGDATYIDPDVLAGKRYYYRVYVMNDHGRLGGSNIVSADVTVDNLIPDGGFESADALSAWAISSSLEGGTAARDTSVAHAGTASLHLTRWGMVKLIQPVAIQKNVAYDLGAFVKLQGNRNNIDDAWIGVYQGATIVGTFPIDLAVPAGSARTQDVDWTNVGPLTFSVTGDGAVTLEIDSYTDNLWLDELQLKPHAQP